MIDKISPYAMFANRETYQDWNTMLVLSWIIQIMCAVVLLLTTPHTVLHGK